MATLPSTTPMETPMETPAELAPSNNKAAEMSNGAEASDVTDQSCPICLNDMNAADSIHPIQCPTACNFNFCNNCLTSFLASSKDDYEMASDGNRHVKIHLNCPNCRADISGTIEDTIRLRRRAMADELQNVPDCELSAKDLRLKYWKETDSVLSEEGEGKKTQKKGTVKPLEIDTSLFGGLEFAMTEQEQKYVTQLMTSGYPDQLCQAAQILSGIAELLRKGKNPMLLPSVSSDRNSTNNSNNAPNSVAANTARTAAALQAANSNNSNMRHGYSNAGIQTTRSREGERETSVSTIQREMEAKAREKLRRPLPARMPLCVTLGTGEFEKMALKSRQEAEEQAQVEANDEQPRSWFRGLLGRGAERMRFGATMTFVDDEWDGTVADAFARARIGTSSSNRKQAVVQERVGPKHPVEQVGVKKILSVGEREKKEGQEGMPPMRTQRVLVGSVRGQAGKSGIMKGDVVTHVNGEIFTGDAANLNAILVKAYEEQGQDGVVIIVVNAEECTAEALRLRSRVR